MTEQQQKLLDVLFEEAQGDLRTAANLAGYSPRTSLKMITAPIADQIAEATSRYMALNGAKALSKIMYVLDNPGKLGNKDLIAAAKELLDRGGFGKKETLDIKAETPLFVLPAKKEEDE